MCGIINALFCAQLIRALGFNNNKYRRIVTHFGSARTALFAESGELAMFGVTVDEYSQICTVRGDEAIAKLQLQLDKASAKILTDEDYPAMLKSIYNAPSVLYCRGKLPDTGNVGIVGTRRPTVYGKAAAKKLATDLAESGFVIVSGAAYGIDTVAHAAALSVNRPTVAVLGCGIDVSYPRENADLLTEISKTGAVISEYPPGTEVRPYYFPMRNRIISGLSRAVIVVEAAEKSGALITADFALDQGRDVFAVPGTIFSEHSAGCHKLIKSGAKLIDCAKDIIDELQPLVLFSHNMINKITPCFSNADEEKIYELLPLDRAITIDEICNGVNISARQANVAIFNMLMRGIVSEKPGNRYSRNN